MTLSLRLVGKAPNLSSRLAFVNRQDFKTKKFILSLGCNLLYIQHHPRGILNRMPPSDSGGWLTYLFPCFLQSDAKKKPKQKPSPPNPPTIKSRPTILTLASASSISSLPEHIFADMRSIALPPPFTKRSDFAYSADGTGEFERALRFLCSQWEMADGADMNVDKAKQAAFYYFERASEGGHTLAISFLGMCTELGIGCERDPKLAASYYLYAVQKRGCAMSCALLASMWHREPLGTLMTVEEAADWARKCPPPDECMDALFHLYDAATSYLVPEANYLVAWLNELGIGMNREEVAAIEHYRRAAVEEYGPACACLGRCYQEGIGVPVDGENAKHWYEIGARRGDPQSMVKLALILSSRSSRGSSPNAGASRQAFELCTRAAELGSPLGFYAMGQCYEHAVGVARSHEHAADMYEIAARRGYADAQFALSSCFTHGFGKPRSSALAVMWTKAAADAGHLPATLVLGKLYFEGIGMQGGAQKQLAVKCFRRAALEGSVEGCYELGLCYRDGHGVQIDDYEAHAWIKRAADQGHPEAAFDMHIMLFEGTERILANPRDSMSWLLKAADAGYGEAQTTLADYFAEPSLCQNMVSRNLYSSHHYYKLAAETGNSYAQYQLAMQYMRGFPLAQQPPTSSSERHRPMTDAFEDNRNEGMSRHGIDLIKALHWMQKAAEQHFDAAEKALPVIKGMLLTKQHEKQRGGRTLAIGTNISDTADPRTGLPTPPMY